MACTGLAPAATRHVAANASPGMRSTLPQAWGSAFCVRLFSNRIKGVPHQGLLTRSSQSELSYNSSTFKCGVRLSAISLSHLSLDLSLSALGSKRSTQTPPPPYALSAPKPTILDARLRQQAIPRPQLQPVNEPHKPRSPGRSARRRGPCKALPCFGASACVSWAWGSRLRRGDGWTRAQSSRATVDL